MIQYTTESLWTIEELKKLNKATLIGMHKAYLAFVASIELLFAIALIISISISSWKMAAEFAIMLILFPLILIIITNSRIKKNYNSNKILQNEVTTLIFNEDKLELSNERGSAYVKYDELYNILETDTNFYLYVAKNQALNVIKANCSNELIGFLQNLKANIKK